VSLDLTSLPAWGSVRDTLFELRASGDSFEEFARRQLDDLDALRAELQQRERELDGRVDDLEREREDLDQTWKRLEQLRSTAEQGASQVQQEVRRLTQLRAELEASQRSLANGQTTHYGEATQSPISQSPISQSPRSPSSWSTDQARGAENDLEKETLRNELVEARRQLAKLAEAGFELAKARGELAKCRAELMRRNLRLAKAKGHFDHQTRQQLTAFEAQCSRLAEELQAATRRTNELTEQAALNQSRMEQERAAWLDELGRIREVLSKQRQDSHDRDVSSASHSYAESSTLNMLTEPGLDSIMEQVDRLQEDLRRHPSKSPKSRS
jgi:DNA repair exonuclease SbcCD ATPase subunit